MFNARSSSKNCPSSGRASVANTVFLNQILLLFFLLNKMLILLNLNVSLFLLSSISGVIILI
jgi:hypothetical protein